MILLVLLSGNADKIIEKNSLHNDIEIIKVDEKDFYDYKDFLKKLKKRNYHRIYYGCLDIKFQRFIFFMHFFNLLSGMKKGAIIDEKGNRIKILNIKTILFEVPFFIFQFLLGLLVTVIYFFRILYNKWRAKL